MKMSYFCAICKLHANAADHGKCKKILRRQHRAEAARLVIGEATQATYGDGQAKLAKYLQTTGTADSIDRDELLPGDTPHAAQHNKDN